MKRLMAKLDKLTPKRKITHPTFQDRQNPDFCLETFHRANNPHFSGDEIRGIVDSSLTMKDMYDSESREKKQAWRRKNRALFQ